MENFFTNLRLVQTTSCRGFNLKNVKHIRLTFLLLSLCFHAIQFWRVTTPSPHFEACLARWHLSYSRALIASSLVLNEVIMSSTYTCNRIMAIASGWSFLLSSACCRTTYWARWSEARSSNVKLIASKTSGSLERCNLHLRFPSDVPPRPQDNCGNAIAH